MSTDATTDRIEPLLRPVSSVVFALIWCKVAAAPTVLGAIAALITFRAAPSPWNVVGACCFSLAGVALGVAWAERLRRRRELLTFVAAESASPDLDNLPAIPEPRRRELLH